MFVIMVIGIIGLAYFLFFSKTGKRWYEENLAKEKKTKEEYEEKIISKFQEEGIRVSLKYKLENFNVLAVDEVNKRVCFLENKFRKNYKSMFDVRFEARSFNYKDILASEVIIDGETVTRTSRTSQLGGALIGGVLTGGVGAIIGGLSGAKTSQEKVRKVQLKLIVNDIRDPILLIPFLDSVASISKKDDKYLKAEKAIQNMHALFVLLIDIADKDDKARLNGAYVRDDVVKSNFKADSSPSNVKLESEKHSEAIVQLVKVLSLIDISADKKEFLVEEKNDENKEEIPNIFSVADEVRKLYELFSDGILTQEEFNSQKKKIIG